MDFKQRLKELKRKLLFRNFRTITGPCSNTVIFRGKEFVMLASNNYLGLNTHPKVIAAAKKASEKYGTGNAASRLIVNLDIHQKLERELAKYKGCAAALVYSSGYAANIGIIGSAAGKSDLIISDELNHASIIDGCRLSKAEIISYKHCSIKDLEKKLAKNSKRKNIQDVLVVTDSVFSMDGDIAPLADIIRLKKKYPFKLMVDDAHATGVIDTNVPGIDLCMGTLSKALASQGGFIASSREVIAYLINTSRPFMYSTGLSPADAAGALEALRIIKKGNSLRNRLLRNAAYMRNGLAELGFDAGGELHIIPIIIGDNKTTMQFQKLLEMDSIFVTGIRFPTVPTARLRISVMATHTKNQLDKALESFKKNGAKLGLL